MGNQHSGRRKSKHAKRTSDGSDGSHALSADSLDLIYIDDYFDDARYLKLVAKRLAEKNAEPKSKRKTVTVSDTTISSHSKNTENSKRSLASSRQSRHIGSVHNTTPSKISVQMSKKSVKIDTSPSPSALPPSSLSVNDMPSRSVSSDATVAEKIAQTSWHGEITSSEILKERKSELTIPTTEHKNSSFSSKGANGLTQQSTLHPPPPVVTVEQGKKQRSILTTSKPQQEASRVVVKRQRSYIIASTSYKSSPKGSVSVTTDWPSSSVNKDRKPQTAMFEPQPQSEASRPTSANNQTAKKKLIVRGLQNFVKTRNKQQEVPLTSSVNHRKHFAGGRGDDKRFVSGPDIWKREFPSKSKFHPDNFIYDWAEGPKAPPRPFSAMAKCKKHGGRCNDCGLFTCDLCQSCRKCETDCACPNRKTTNACCGSAYTPKEVYSEIFGGDGWNKACKVLCNLTEQDKTYPVGGNANKKKQGCDESWAKNNNFYKSQIDVLNPYNVPLTDTSQCSAPQPMLQHPICAPPMFPMPFMPFMAMPPPMMHYYPPSLSLPPCPSYDPCCAPPSYPYPSSDSFMPAQNY